MIELISELTAIWGPPGHEGRVAEALMALVKPHVDSVRRDALGNVIATRQGGGKRVLLMAHMDVPGGVVTHVEEGGLLRIAGLGPFTPALALGQRVVFGHGLVGTVCSDAEGKELTAQRLWLDCGFRDGEQARHRVQPGDAWVYAAPAQAMGQRLIAPGLDGRAACAVLVEIARHLYLIPPELTVHLVFTVQELPGPRAGGAAAFGLQPDLAVVVDASPAGEVPGGPRTPARVGGGCVLRVKDGRFISHTGLIRLLGSLAEAHAVPHCREVLGDGTSEAVGVEVAGAGVPTAVVGLPLRYAGTPGEVMDTTDARAAADLLLQLLSSELDIDWRR